MIVDGMDDGRHDQRHERDSGDSIFFEVLTGVARKSPTGFRFNRLMDDFSSISSFLNDIRICLIALTILIYCVLIGYLVQKCVEHRRKSADGRRQWDFQAETPAALECRNECRNQSTQLDLVSVRSDGQIGNATNTNSTLPPASIGQNSYLNRNHRSSTPSMMRHNRHQFSLGHEIGNGAKATEKTKLMSPEQETPIKHQIPHIITSDLAHHSYSDASPPTNEDPSKSPTLHGIRPQRSPVQTRNESTDM